MKAPFASRHIGPNEDEIGHMLNQLNLKSTDALIEATIPASIHSNHSYDWAPALSENNLLATIRSIALKNQVFRSYIGMGYAGTITPPVIQRNILENPGWYTQYTPYQAEIAQGRLEALLNFQTLVSDMTGLPIANASLLDEATAAAEAMTLCYSGRKKADANTFLVAQNNHPQVIGVVRTRAEALGIQLQVARVEDFSLESAFAVLLPYPTTEGAIPDYSGFLDNCKKQNVLTIFDAEFLSLAVLKSPGEWGVDVAVGSTQRFGVPMGFGGPHAAYLATKDEFKRQMPGRIVGVSKDAEGNAAIRLALQTREQHIRRDKATSNICTAQVLLAIMASMYAVYHGPEGVRAIAEDILRKTHLLAEVLRRLGFTLHSDQVFDTLKVSLKHSDAQEILASAQKKKINLRQYWNSSFSELTALGITLDETVQLQDLNDLVDAFALRKKPDFILSDLEKKVAVKLSQDFHRKTAYLTHPVFNQYHSETEMLRYIRKLESRDLSLTGSMIPLGSCTMKLNATTEMLPVTWPEFGSIHPFVPRDQVQGYRELITDLEKMLAELTGFDAVSLQPNAGSQGEYAGLLAIRKYHEMRGDTHRTVCLIPRSAHGTNPASAALAGMKVVVTECDSNGNVDLNDLRSKAQEHRKDLSALMITYPSTHGVFETAIREICAIVHENGGQVYMDGANLNAQMGWCRPGEYGPDVCHLNLHKTFCIPHGGGGPGMGPIAVKAHLADFLPAHPISCVGGKNAIGPVSAAAWGSPSILPISWAYIKMMGIEGLKKATQVAILNANYVASRLDAHYPVLYRGEKGFVAHECIVDLRQLKATSGVEVAKRLMDYGFHAPTISFPVPGTMMIEPTESESLAELDRFCEAMISIRKEIEAIEKGKADRKNNLLKNAPHTARAVVADAWDRPYTREEAVFPAAWVRDHKFWPSVARIDNVAGDRNLICTCPGIDEY